MSEKKNKLIRVAFDSSYGLQSKYPDSPQRPHIAFCGRSNAGKSSLIYHLVEKKVDVKVSATPGKTKTLNFFLINDNFFLVDLPGFGYAKASHKEREDMIVLINRYLNNAKNLKVLFILCDCKRELPEEEKEIIQVCYDKGIVPIVVRTKLDKLNAKERNRLNKEISVLKKMFPQVKIVKTSVKSNLGIVELREMLLAYPIHQ
ncbi:MAG: ribosome biogenesis GTP-binding protein YihA/YsxC [Spirochaetota bacterium]